MLFKFDTAETTKASLFAVPPPQFCCEYGVYLFVEGRGFHVEGEGTMSRVEGNIFFFNFFF